MKHTRLILYIVAGVYAAGAAMTIFTSVHPSTRTASAVLLWPLDFLRGFFPSSQPQPQPIVSIEPAPAAAAEAPQRAPAPPGYYYGRGIDGRTEVLMPIGAVS